MESENNEEENDNFCVVAWRFIKRLFHKTSIFLAF